MRQQGDVNKAPAVKCLAHGGEQDRQVGTQAPTREAFNNYSFFLKERVKFS